MPTIDTGVLLTTTMPQSLRDFYNSQLLQVLRAQTIFQQFSIGQEDLGALNTKQIVLTKVYDLMPAIGALTEAEPWLSGAFLNSKQYTMTIREHGNTLKFNRYHTNVMYWDDGNMQGLVRDKLGRNMVESMELLARNAYLDTSRNSHLSYPNNVTARKDLMVTDIFTPTLAALSRTNLESRNAVALNMGQSPVCIIHPRQAHDIREASGSKWKEAAEYGDPSRLFTGEIGMLDGVRYVKNNFCRLPNAGAVVAQTTLSAALAAGEGGPDSDDITGYKTYATVTSSADFAVGMEVAIHSATYAGFVAGDPCPVDDSTAEYRRIVSKETGKLYFDEPVGGAHANGAYVTEARDLYMAAVVAGPGLVYGYAIQPALLTPPVIDDAMRIFRLTWYGVFDYTLLQDQYVECWVTAASTANHGAA
jgi:N4-gp56 family major capsid protein